MKVKLIGAYGNSDILEKEINDFMVKVDEVIEIQYQMALTNEEVLFSALIIYSRMK